MSTRSEIWRFDNLLAVNVETPARISDLTVFKLPFASCLLQGECDRFIYNTLDERGTLLKFGSVLIYQRNWETY